MTTLKKDLVFFSHFLVFLAAWTLVIKFVFPVAMAAGEGASLGKYIYWDFWWVVHLLLARVLTQWHRHSLKLIYTTCVVEILIIVVKFYMFLNEPVWSIWQTNWFINKVFVLTCFVWLFYFTLKNHGALRAFNAASPKESQ